MFTASYISSIQVVNDSGASDPELSAGDIDPELTVGASDPEIAIIYQFIWHKIAIRADVARSRFFSLCHLLGRSQRFPFCVIIIYKIRTCFRFTACITVNSRRVRLSCRGFFIWSTIYAYTTRRITTGFRCTTIANERIIRSRNTVGKDAVSVPHSGASNLCNVVTAVHRAALCDVVVRSFQETIYLIVATRMT